MENFIKQLINGFHWAAFMLNCSGYTRVYGIIKLIKLLLMVKFIWLVAFVGYYHNQYVQLGLIPCVIISVLFVRY